MSRSSATQGRAIHVLRVVLGLTQAQLAQSIGTGTSSVSDWEKGKVVPREQSVEKLLNAVQLPHAALDRTERYIREIEALLARRDETYGSDSVASEIAEGGPSMIEVLGSNPLLQPQIDRLSAGAVQAASGFAGLIAEALAPLLAHRLEGYDDGSSNGDGSKPRREPKG